MPDYPQPWETILLVAAAFRIWRLLSVDDVLDRPRRWILRLGDWKAGEIPPIHYRASWGEFLLCPWCLGFWVGLAWWVAWIFEPEWTLAVAVPWAISAGVGIVRGQLDPPE